MEYNFKSGTVVPNPQQTNEGSLGTSVPGIIVEKYMIELTRYPNGKVFTRIFEVGAYQKMQKSKKQKVKSVKSISSVKESEEI